MSITFNEIPSDLLVPFVTAEIDSSQASQGPALLRYRAVLIGQKTSAGSAAPNSLHRVTSAARVSALAGRGSLLHRKAIAWFASNKVTELWIAVLEDDAGGAAAVGSIDVGGPATEAGTIPLYIGGQRVPVAVADAETADDIATAIAAAINADLDLPVTAAVDGVTTSKVNVTFRHKGEVGNGYNLRDSYRDDESLPAGVSLTYVQPTGGTTNPDLAALIAALGDTWFHIWAHPYTDATSLAVLEAELASRFAWNRMIDGVAITSAGGTHSALTTLGDGRNSKHSMIVAQPGANPLTPPFEFAAERAAIAARYGQEDPARPQQTLPMVHALAPAEVDRFTLEERNLLLHDGIATTKVGGGGTVQVEGSVTTYQEDPNGADDTAYQQLATLLNIMYLRYSFRVRIQTRYPRHKLADDGTRFGPGQAVITPKIGKGEAIAWFEEQQQRGLVENLEQFEQDLVVARNQANPNRLDFLLPPDLINQLIVSAVKFAFRQ